MLIDTAVTQMDKNVQSNSYWFKRHVCTTFVFGYVWYLKISGISGKNYIAFNESQNLKTALL